MPSRTRRSIASMGSPHRYSIVLIVGGMLVLVSSFSTLLPPTSTSRQGCVYPENACSLTNPFVAENPRSQRVSFQSTSSRSPVLSMASPSSTAEDCQEARNLFAKYCDSDSLLAKKTLETMPPFAGMLADEDLLPEELNDIWEAATKSSTDPSRVNADSFVQIYRDVDDLFEDDEEGGEGGDESSSESLEAETPAAETKNDNGLDEELSKAYKSLCDDNGLISKSKMQKWEEIESLLEEGLLGEDEFEELWENSVDSKSKSIDANGFLTFNSGLDDLFVLDDDNEDEDVEDADVDVVSEDVPEPAPAPRAMVIEGDMPPGVLFSQLADANYVVGMKELNLWAELKDLLDDEELSPSELQEMYDKYATSEGKLTEDGFLQLYDDIDALFEEDDDDDDDDAEEAVPSPPPPPQQQQSQDAAMNARVKDDFLSFIDIIVEDDDEPCGFGATESDQAQLLNILQVLEQQPSNVILQKDGNIELVDLAGNWELIYTSSSAMKFNKGLSGIGGSFPNGRFGGLRQELKCTKFLSDVEYKERIEVTPSSASFDVTVSGIWDLRKSVSLFTGQTTVILNVEPDRVTYGPTSTRADHWKSLGPVNRLDLSYLDDNLRVMRGCTSSETLFIFKKVN